MKSETRKKAKEYISEFVKNLKKIDFSIEELKKAFPFHSLFFPEEALIAFKEQRSIVTKMGQTFFPALAKIIALDKYKEVRRNYQISGELDVAKIEAIDKIVNELRMGKKKPDHEKEMQEILAAKEGTKRNISVIADLYIADFKPGPLFLELKSPRPNLDVCAESKKKILFFKALLDNKNPRAFLALYYNPFVYREKYAHTFTKQIMDLKNEVLIGEEFWEKIGGKGTYKELLDIVKDIKKKQNKKSKF